MATEALKSTSITNLDSTPITANTAGEGAPGALKCANDSVSSTAGVTVGSTYRVCRIPTNAKVKSVKFSCAAHGGASAFDIDVAYTDSTNEGGAGALTGIVQISAADNKLFGAAVSAVSALSDAVETLANTFTIAMKNVPLWQALITAGTTDFTADPGGYFDIMLKSTATDTSGGALGIEVDYVMD
jgi:hypothetical protein